MKLRSMARQQQHDPADGKDWEKIYKQVFPLILEYFVVCCLFYVNFNCIDLLGPRADCDPSAAAG